MTLLIQCFSFRLMANALRMQKRWNMLATVPINVLCMLVFLLTIHRKFVVWQSKLNAWAAFKHIHPKHCCVLMRCIS
ncbi:hypothetical protein SLE2022_023150 [Rubroshorea leprosula]